jgi:excisionase family DNA binding protein
LERKPLHGDGEIQMGVAMSKFKENVDGETLGIEQAAQLMRLGYEATRQLIDAGEIPAVIFNQRHVVLLREDVIAYIHEQGQIQAQQRRRVAKRPKGHATTPRAAAQRPSKRKVPPDLSLYELLTKGE